MECSDGAGRTGTYCLIDMVLNRMAKGAKEIDIAATLEHIRDQRVRTVATKQQFEFVLMAVAEEVRMNPYIFTLYRDCSVSLSFDCFDLKLITLLTPCSLVNVLTPMLKNIQTNSIVQVHAILKALPAHLQQMQEKKDKEKEKDKDTEKEKPN